MKNTWRSLFRRLTVGCAVSGSVAWSSAMCYAVQVAYDTASDPVYSNGWQEGDNGGFGFGPWNFDGVGYNGMAYNTTTQLAIDDGLKTGTQTSSPYNDIGRAWTLANPRGRDVGNPNSPYGTDISQPGRKMPALQVGHTLSVVLDNPLEYGFYRGYALKLNSGPDASGCYAGDNCSTPAYDPGAVTIAWGVGTFEYFDYGPWDGTTLFNYHTDAGVRIDFTLTGATSYSFTMTPLDGSAAPFTKTGALTTTDPIDWIELEFYNTDSDFYPTMIANPLSTDFYVRSMEITSPAPPGVPGDYNADGAVNAADYVLARKHLGTGFQLTNEVSGVSPGSVMQDDITAWQARFGNIAGAGGGAGAVPEPSTLVYVLFAAAGMLLWGMRRPAMEYEPCPVKPALHRD